MRLAGLALVSLLSLVLLVVPVPPSLVVLVCAALLWVAWSADRIVLALQGARVVVPDASLHRLLAPLSAAAGSSTPHLAVVSSESANALSVAGPSGSTIVISEGLLRVLDARSLRALLAREVAHATSASLPVKTLLVAAVELPAWLARRLADVLPQRAGEPSGSPYPRLVRLALSLTAPVSAVLAQLVSSARSTLRLDAEGAALSSDGPGLALALGRLHEARFRGGPFVSPACAMLCAVDPFAGAPVLSRLFVNQPSIQERAHALLAPALRSPRPVQHVSDEMFSLAE